MVRHQLSEIDVVALVNRGKGSRNHQSNARPALALCGGLPRGTCSFPVSRYNHFEIAIAQGIGGEQALPLELKSRIRMGRNVGGFMIEANPSRCHGVRVDVVQKVIHAQVLHTEIQFPFELCLDQR